MNIDMWRRKNSRAIIGSVWPLGISLGVVLFALRPSVGTTPMLFDDYQFAYEHGQMGWIDHAARLFRSWTGRVLMNTASGPVTSLPSSFTRWAGTFCVAVGCLSIALTLNFLVRNADKQSDLRSKDGNTIALTLTTSLVWLAGIPAWFQTTQWMAGQLVYLLPVCCAFGGGSLCWRGWARGDLSSRMQRTGGTLLLMIAASGNETLAISIPVALFLLFACNAKSGVPGHRSARTKKVVLSGAVLLAASVVLLAPGSRVRGRAVPNDRSLDAIGQRITDGLGVFSSVSILTMLLPSIALVVLGNQLPHTYCYPSVTNAACGGRAVADSCPRQQRMCLFQRSP